MTYGPYGEDYYEDTSEDPLYELIDDFLRYEVPMEYRFIYPYSQPIKKCPFCKKVFVLEYEDDNSSDELTDHMRDEHMRKILRIVELEDQKTWKKEKNYLMKNGGFPF